MAHQQYQACLEASIRCAVECEHCAQACLRDPNVQGMAVCIGLNRDCSATCWLAVTFMIRRSQFDTAVCQLCAAICSACGTECEKHKSEHCQRCAEARRACADACREKTRAA